ncbi:MAG TPA: restriction endonuclease [Brevundimonas sp.]|uniref:McrC family protein n=1 Tax=Brevundimonas sp. TaxID=1871086 RepID=UPI002DE6C4F6|nr:restriction endonuclease [Brevundimonas sp.]
MSGAGVISVGEWGRLPIREDDSQGSVTSSQADALMAGAAAVERKLGIGSGEGASVLVRTHKELCARQVVGVLAVPGVELEILPKIDRLGEDGVRGVLIHMVAHAWDLPIADGEAALFSRQEKTLLEILIRLFCDRLFKAVHRGLSRRYLDHEDDLPSLRGRLNVQRQFTTNVITPNRLACGFSELSSDIALNQVLKGTVVELAKWSRSTRNRRLLLELELAFEGVSSLPRDRLPWDQVHLDRTDARYRELFDLARALMNRRWQTTTAGDMGGTALMFEMNTLFEAYLGRHMRAVGRAHRRAVALQGPRKFILFDENGSPRFATKPDIVVGGPDGPHVIDTKWKRLQSADVDAKRGVNQADVYQMLAYGQVYGAKRLTLLYPHHRGLAEEAGRLAAFTMPSTGTTLEIATVDVSDLRSVPHQCARLISSRHAEATALAG